MALALVVLLPNDVAALNEETSNMIGGSAGDAASSGKNCDLDVFQVTLPIFNIFYFCPTEPQEGCHHFGSHERAVD